MQTTVGAEMREEFSRSTMREIAEAAARRADWLTHHAAMHQERHDTAIADMHLADAAAFRAVSDAIEHLLED